MNPQTRSRPGNPGLRTYAAEFGDPAQHSRSPSPTSSFADHEVEITLADITNFDLRQKTAQLKAVAPGLPVSDLYHMLVERKGHFEVAKQDVIRASQAPCGQPFQAKPAAFGRAATVPVIAPIYVKDGDEEDEDMVKIDLEDPVFMWDNDAPATPPPEPTRRKQSNQARSKTTTQRKKTPVRPLQASKSAPARVRRPKPAGSCLSETIKVQSAKLTKIVTSSGLTAALPSRFDARKPKGRGAVDINRGIRATSYDREFIVPDEQSVEESDESYSESDGEHMGDIDMEPEYAYNSDVLSSPGTA